MYHKTIRDWQMEHLVCCKTREQYIKMSNAFDEINRIQKEKEDFEKQMKKAVWKGRINWFKLFKK